MTVQTPEALAASLLAAVGRGFGDWSEQLAANLADRVEIVHRPPVPALDGTRSAEAAAAYLREEAVAFPRAFEDDFRVEAMVVPGGEGLLAAFVYSGTLRSEDRPVVSVGFHLDIVLESGRVVKLVGSPSPDTTREDMVGWLKAVEAAGGFHPPAAS
jgi:hypothetical protein